MDANYRMPKANGTVPLATEHLNLRPFKGRDAEALAKWSQDTVTLKYFVTPPLDEDEAAQSIASWRHQYKNNDFMCWALALADSDRCIGMMEASLDSKLSCAEVSYAVSPGHRGNGYAREALKEVVRYLHDTCDVHRIVAKINTDNSASVKVAEKNGFELEGIHRDALTDRHGRYYDVAVLAHLSED